MLEAVSNINFYPKNSQPVIKKEAKINFGQSNDQFVYQNQPKKSFWEENWGKILISAGLLIAGGIILYKYKKAPKEISGSSKSATSKLNSIKNEVIKKLDKEIEKNPNVRSYHDRGLEYRKLGCYTEALNDFAESIKFDPTNPVPYIELGLTHKKMKEYDKALSYYTKVIENISPDNPLALYNRAILHYEAKNPKAAFDDINKAIQINPADADYQKFRKDICENLILELDKEINANPAPEKLLKLHSYREYILQTFNKSNPK